MALPSVESNPSTLFASASMSSNDFSVFLLIFRSSCFAMSFAVRTAVEFSCFLSLSISDSLILQSNFALILAISDWAVELSKSGIIRLPPMITILSTGLPVSCETNVFSFS